MTLHEHIETLKNKTVIMYYNGKINIKKTKNIV